MKEIPISKNTTWLILKADIRGEGEVQEEDEKEKNTRRYILEAEE